MRIKCLGLLAFACSMNLGLSAVLERSLPEDEGVSSAAILDFVQGADKQANSLHSFMLVRHGKVVAECWWKPYDTESPHALYSLSKSFTSTAVGLAIAEGKFGLDDEITKFFPEQLPEAPSANLKSMRVRDLLRMNTGHQTEPPRPANESWRKAFLSHAVTFKPGTHFLYNTPATYMLSAIVEKTTGASLVDYLQPRLFEPLGIKSPQWDKSPEGITLGGYGLSVRTEDIALFGQLYLQGGRWNEKQLVPSSWVQLASSFQTSNGSNPKSDWDQGYGFQFWRCRHNCFRGDGAFGQYCIVMPEQDAVIAITSGLGNMQLVLDLVWEKLLPGFQTAKLPKDPASNAKLRQGLASLSLPTPEGKADGANVYGRGYKLEANARALTKVTLEKSSDGGTALLLESNGKKDRIDCGFQAWRKGTLTLGGQEQAVAASGAWVSKDTFVAKICAYHTPFVHTLSLKFVGEELRLNSEVNVSFGPTKEPEVRGTPAGDS